MPAAIRIALKTILAATVASATITALVWPWPVPEVDWRTPLARALANSDCERAAAIVNAATQAGSVEALEMLADPASLDPCFKAPALRMHAPDTAPWLRGMQNAPAPHRDPWRTEDANALAFPIRQYLEIVNFLCRRPYDTHIRTDHVALSAVLKEEFGWALAIHRQRRDACMVVIDDLMTTLAERGDGPSKELAFTLATYPPAMESEIAAIIAAELILRQPFVPRAGRSSFPIERLRDTAWSRLTRVAQRPSARAMEMTIKILHEGRFVPSNRLWSSQSPYFWVLRSRRLGLPATALHAKVQRSLTDEERARIRRDEEYHWANHLRV